MKYTTGIPYVGWIIVSLLASLIASAMLAVVLRAFQVEVYGMRALLLMAILFVVVFILLAIVSTGSAIQLEKGRILIGQRRKTTIPPIEVPVTDIAFTEMVADYIWRLYPTPQAEGKYIKDKLPVRQCIEGFYITAYKGLTPDIVRNFCKENRIIVYEVEQKWQHIEQVEFKKHSIRIEYSLKRNFLWKEKVVARHRDIQSLELCAHQNKPGHDYYIIHMHSGKTYEFGYNFIWSPYNEIKAYTQKHGIPFNVMMK